MHSKISLKGIDETIKNFPRTKRKSLKYKLITTIRKYYQYDSDIGKTKRIPPDDLIKILWNTGDDPAKIKEKKKNFSNLKSTLNRDLRNMFYDGKNPEGIKVGLHNVFVMSDEMKDQIIKRFDLGIKSVEVRVPEGDNEQKKIERDEEHKPDARWMDQIYQEEKKESGDDTLFQDMTGSADKELIKEKLKELIETIKTEKLIWEAHDIAAEIESLMRSLKDEAGKEREGQKKDKELDLQAIIEEIDKGLIDQKLLELLEKLKSEKCLIDTKGTINELENIIANIESNRAHIKEGNKKNADRECRQFNNEGNIQEVLFDTQVLIPKGIYILGNKGFKRDEQPEKKVELDAFYLDKYPVTNAQFMIFVKETGYKTSAERQGAGEVCLGKYQRIEDPQTGVCALRYNNGNTFKTVEGAFWMCPFGPGSSIQEKMDHPVVQVSLEDALAFAEWTGKRLITEFEWEAAARGSDGRPFPWGFEWKKVSCNHAESTISDTTSVNYYGESGKSPLEVYDMVGNIFEWTRTPYHDPFTNNTLHNYYVIKGGSWATEGILTAAKRLMKHAQSWSNTIGFRCAKDHHS